MYAVAGPTLHDKNFCRRHGRGCSSVGSILKAVHEGHIHGVCVFGCAVVDARPPLYSAAPFVAVRISAARPGMRLLMVNDYKRHACILQMYGELFTAYVTRVLIT
jgi:hypothetical protein